MFLISLLQDTATPQTRKSADGYFGFQTTLTRLGLEPTTNGVRVRLSNRAGVVSVIETTSNSTTVVHKFKLKMK